MNFAHLKTEILRAIRGPRSQTQLSRKLGYRGNQVFRWESGERAISWPAFAALCTACDVQLPAALSQVFGYRAKPDDFSKLFSKLIGDVKLTDVAARLGCSRFSVMRWTKGQTQPDLEHFLALIHHYHFVLFEFLERIVEIKTLPSVAQEYERRKAQKDIHYHYPIADAVLSCIELDEYQALRRHAPGFFAKKLGITLEEETRVVAKLREAGILRTSRSGKLQASAERPDLRGDPRGMNAIRDFWLRRALEFNRGRDFEGRNSSFGTVVLPSSRAAAAGIKKEYYAFYHRVRAILQAAQGPRDRVQVFNFQLFDLSER